MITYELLQKLSRCGYKKYTEYHSEVKLIAEEHSSNGVDVKIFQHKSTGKIIMVYGGTEVAEPPYKDLRADINLAVKNLPQQFPEALAIYKKYEKIYGKSNIELTGESLGASQVVYIGVKTGVKVTGFRTYGIGDFVEDREYPNIVNIGSTKDSIFMANINRQVGKTYIVPDEDGKIYQPHIISGLKSHMSEEELPLKNMQEYKRGTLPSYMENLESGKANPIINRWYNDLDNLYKKDKNGHSASQDVHESMHNLYNVINNVNQSAKNIKNKVDDFTQKIPIKPKTRFTGFASDIRNGIDAIPDSSCVGSYPVSGYTRSDGTKVSAYIRTCGAKHSKIPKLNNLSKEEIDELMKKYI